MKRWGTWKVAAACLALGFLGAWAWTVFRESDSALEARLADVPGVTSAQVDHRSYTFGGPTSREAMVIVMGADESRPFDAVLTTLRDMPRLDEYTIRVTDWQSRVVEWTFTGNPSDQDPELPTRAWTAREAFGSGSYVYIESGDGGRWHVRVSSDYPPSGSSDYVAVVTGDERDVDFDL